MARYHGLKVSDATISRVLKRHGEDLGIRHVYIKARTPQLNGKVERSHRSDLQEFYQLMKYKDDVDLEAKLAKWEAFYNFARPQWRTWWKNTL